MFGEDHCHRLFELLVVNSRLISARSGPCEFRNAKMKQPENDRLVTGYIRGPHSSWLMSEANYLEGFNPPFAGVTSPQGAKSWASASPYRDVPSDMSRAGAEKLSQPTSQRRTQVLGPKSLDRNQVDFTGA